MNRKQINAKVASKKSKLSHRAIFANYLKSHKKLTAASVVILAAIITLLVFVLNSDSLILSRVNESVENNLENSELKNLEASQEDLSKLGISSESLQNSSPVSRSSGSCVDSISGTSMSYIEDGNGNILISTRNSSGKYECVKYNVDALRNYKSDDASITTTTEANGNKKTIITSTDASGDTKTTTKVDRPDGSSITGFEGQFIKSCFTASPKICAYIKSGEKCDAATNSCRMYTFYYDDMSMRVMSCKLWNQDGSGAYSIATPEQRELLKADHTVYGSACGDSRIPEPFYE